MKLQTSLLICLLISVLSSTASAQNGPYISAIIDAQLSGGLPKAVLLRSEVDVEDMSIYSISLATNGSVEYNIVLPLSGSMQAGDEYWVAKESTSFSDFFGCQPTVVKSGLNFNGDDVIALTVAGIVIDKYGEVGTDGTGTCWDYTDGYAYRTVTTTTSLFSSDCSDGEWVFSGPFTLIGITQYDEIVPSEPFGTLSFPACDGANDGYYDSIDTVSMSCSALKTELSQLISGHFELAYGPTSSFDVIDFMCQEDYQNGVMVDRYGTTNYTDCLGDRYTSGANPTTEGQGWNREHSMPSSWWGGSQTVAQYTDLHHLFPSDAYVNSKKSNLSMGKVESGLNGAYLVGPDLYGCAQGCSSLVYEPGDEYKGDMARAYLYMGIRYEEEIPSWTGSSCVGDDALSGDTHTVFSDCLLARLLEWHQTDPPSPLEESRNEAIFAVQGNRNPLIDHPSWAGLIWGTSDGLNITSNCLQSGCTSPVWHVEEVQSNSSFNNGGQWTPINGGFSVNGYCGSDCAEVVDSWIISGPYDIESSGPTLFLQAQENYGFTPLQFQWTDSYTGCPDDPENDWQLTQTLWEGDLPGSDTYYPVTIDFSAATGEAVYFSIRYFDEGTDGYNRWRLIDMAFDEADCPPLADAPFAVCCRPDIDRNGSVDIDDFILFNSIFGQSCTDCKADINQDGLVDVEDFLLFNSVFGIGCE